MLRALAKATVLAAFGRIPGGAKLYRTLTRKHLGTAASHVDKLKRVWPHYADAWRTLCGLDLEGATIWIHEPGATPFSPLAAYVVTGTAGITTSKDERTLSRYIARSVNAVMESGLGCDGPSSARLRDLERLRWQRSWPRAMHSLGGEVIVGAEPNQLTLASGSVDLCHSGGVLEHYRLDMLGGFLRECYRILKPGGVASHVFDHRDHLYHADKRIPFAAHLALPERMYEVLLGHELSYHSRISPTDVARQFENVGFERVAVRKMILPAQIFVADEEVPNGQRGLRRSLLARRFRSISDDDLATAAAHYVFRKPS